MAERTTKVRISAQIQEYVAGMEKAAQVTRETGTAAEKLGQKKEAFQTLGAGAVVVGGAMTALTLAVAKTGIEYNTLQQTSRAALTTLLGSAEAANAQMDKLDEFARTSPFSKTVFIQAQQQLLGFGMAADRVVPTLDAIQNAVAATGGSNQDIAELVRIIAQLEGGVKISAETFNQFGTRGIDAAQLIGDAMGKTGAQIRDEVTAGTLDASAAVKALTDGMSERFAGAADNVKDTFAGATDRVQAAWRDLSADLMKPLVDPNGGGALVDFLNQVADVTRGIQALPEPLKVTGGAIFALTGLTALAGGAFIAAVPKVAAYNAAIATLGGGAQRASRLLGVLAKGAGAAVGFLALAKGAEMAATALGQMGDGAKTANETLSLLNKGDYDGVFDGITTGITGLGDAFDTLLSSDASTAFNRWGSDLFAFTGLTSKVGESREQFALLGDALAEMVNAGDGDRAAEIFDEIRAKAEKQGYSVEQLNEIMPQYQDALLGVENDALAAAEATDSTTDAFDAQAEAAAGAEDALSAMKDALDGIGSTAMSMSEAKDAAVSAITALTEAAEAEGAAIDGTDEASIRLRDSMRDVESSHRDAAEAIIENGGTLADAQLEYDKGREAVIGMLEAKGMDRAEAVRWADQQLGSATEVKGGIDEVYRAWLNLPENKETKYKVEAAEAEAKLAALKASIDGLPQYKSITLETITLSNNRVISAPGNDNANGGIYQNKVKAFAAGGTSPGIYAYQPGGIHRFAEEYDEAYISMDPARRQRSFGVWQQVGQMAGFSQQSQQQSPVDVSRLMDGMSISGTLDLGNGLTGFVDGRINSYDASANRASRGGVRF